MNPAQERMRKHESHKPEPSKVDARLRMSPLAALLWALAVTAPAADPGSSKLLVIQMAIDGSRASWKPTK